MNTIDVFQEQLDALRKKSKEADALYDELDTSYRLQQIFPDVFEHGRCKATWVNVERAGQKSVNYKTTRGDGSVREIHFEDLPESFVDHLIKEKGISGLLGADYKFCGKTLLTEKLSKIVSARKNKGWAKKVYARIEERKNRNDA